MSGLIVIPKLSCSWNTHCSWFQDEEDQADTLTLNLANSPLDLPTEQLHVELQLDPELHRDNWILDCGQSGNQCRYGEGRWQDQTFVFDSNQVLDYQAVNLTLNFDEGTFASAPVYRGLSAIPSGV